MSRLLEQFIKRFAPWIGVLAVVIVVEAPAPGASIQELTRLRGQGQSVLQGFGLVTGLPGTGDSGEDLIVARPLAKLLESQGNPIESFDELAQSRSVAVVIVTCRIPESGAKVSDRYDVIVSAMNNPDSLAGGQLFLTPLRGPYPGQPVYAVAEGPLTIEDENNARARVRGGAQMIRDIDMTSIAPDGSLTLIIEPAVAGWTTAQLLADTINDHRLGLDQSTPPIANASDARSVRVRIPEPELQDPANFISDIMSIRFDPSLLSLPAVVRVNEREGVIVITGNVQISPVLITHKDLVITTVTPPPNPTEINPVVEQDRWSPLSTAADDVQTARLDDLLEAFKRLNVPIQDQIAIITQLERTGRLHAELIFD